ncbi:hypothetical protein [Mesorhizobium sp. M0698]|uniref:hypothetical protein n=1 Tax=Mesorhizobium sp. M0698 TaxID=2956987 RepID=UPI00333797CD
MTPQIGHRSHQPGAPGGEAVLNPGDGAINLRLGDQLPLGRQRGELPLTMKVGQCRASSPQITGPLAHWAAVSIDP